jgi:DNA helicase IV
MRRIVTDVPSSFREFRKQCIQNESFYIDQPEKNSHISSLELDAVVHLTLKSAGEILSQRYIARIIEEPSMSWLKIIESQFKNQVLVDEVADFSALQLGAMFNLTKGNRKSFFSCGDFNQRIVSSGVRSLEQIQWACPGIESQTITTVYRQSRRLNEFARLLLEVTVGDQSALGELPRNHSHIGFAPVLIENCSGTVNITLWLFERIREVEMNIRKMPTIAILVNSEDEVKPMAEELTVHLEQINLRAMPCSEGQTLGEDSDIRVFDVQHIKGLEFEAVFFVNIDQLAELKPDIFDKFLYVGATRAATYLGVSSSEKIPDSLESLREQFLDSW